MKKNKRNKGFTLIELIAAIAILTITMIGIESAISYSAKTMKKNDIKIENHEFSQYIIQSFKSRGVNYFSKFYYDKVKGIAGATSHKFYLYFDDSNELNTVLSSDMYDTNIYHNGTYNNMILNPQNKEFGACVEINPVSIVPGDVTSPKNIRVNVKVVSLKRNNKISSDLLFYMGR